MRTMKVMRQLAVGTLFAAAAASGMTACNNGNRKNVDNILNEDRVELSPQSGGEGYVLSRVSYEPNEGLNRRSGFGDNDDLCEQYGTYGATAKQQRKLDYIRFMMRVSDDSHESSKAFGIFLDYQNEMNKCIEAKSSTPTAGQCITALDEFAIKTNGFSGDDLEVYMGESQAYEKTHRINTVQGAAEYIAYKQCMLDLIILGNLLNLYDCFDNPNFYERYEQFIYDSMKDFE